MLCLTFCFSVIPYFNADGDRYLPLPIVQNAARLLTDVDPSTLSVRRMSPIECHFINESCRAAGMDFFVDPATLVVGLLTVYSLVQQPPTVRFLPNEDPLGSAQYVDIQDTSSSSLRIVDVRGNVDPASTELTSSTAAGLQATSLASGGQGPTVAAPSSSKVNGRLCGLC